MLLGEVFCLFCLFYDSDGISTTVGWIGACLMSLGSSIFHKVQATNFVAIRFGRQKLLNFKVFLRSKTTKKSRQIEKFKKLQKSREF